MLFNDKTINNKIIVLNYCIKGLYHVGYAQTNNEILSWRK